MKRNAWLRGMAAAGLGLLASVGGAKAQAPAAAMMDRAPGDLPGPIDSYQDIQDTARMLFKLADTNNDGQISQKEANDVGNLMVGGFFFRADTNGDGTLSKEELQSARESLYQQKPYLRVLVERAKNQAQAASGGNNATNPAQAIFSVLDSNSDQKIQAMELRQAVQTGVTAFYAVADTNRDGQMSPTEINSAVVGMARSAAQEAFRTADSDRDGQLSRGEFDKAIIEPANMIFAMVDVNGDGKISEQEAQAARQFLLSQVQRAMLPEAPNSARNLIKSGATPDQVAPVPNFTPGARPGTTTQPIPR